MMEWLPAPDDFSAALRAATAQEDADARFKQLAALAGRRLDFLQTIRLHQAIKRVPTGERKSIEPVRLALLSSSTVDHLVPGITVAGLRRRLLFDTYVAPYGQYRQVLLDADSPLAGFAPNVALFSVSARQILANVSSAATEADAATAADELVADLTVLWAKARERFGAVVVQQTFLAIGEPLFGGYDRVVPGAPASLIARLNDRLAREAARENVLLLDIARESERHGLDTWFDRSRWLQGKMEIAPPMGPLYGELVARVVGAQRGLSKKCLVLDLDNTLWGGVVGDVGQEGIVLGEGSGIGEAFLELQRYARQLRNRGIILAVCSKNDPAIAENVFRDHPEMLLRLSDIAVFVANWDDKAANLLAIAERLNIGVDSLVFVDDNPAERARVRESLPMVAVPELPANPGDYVRCLADAGYFEAVTFTAEDVQRAEQYATNASREALRVSAGSLDAFLKGLEMSVAYGPFRTVDLQRIGQLLSKTNQFNPTTRRYSLHQVTEMVATDHFVTLQFRLVDRFGDNGLVSAMIMRRAADDPYCLVIDAWVMSCRVFGRQLETEAMNIAVEKARSCGIKTLRASYIPTPKNGVVKDLYAKLGFAQVDEAPTAANETRWRLDLEQYERRCTFIASMPLCSTAEAAPA